MPWEKGNKKIKWPQRVLQHMNATWSDQLKGSNLVDSASSIHRNCLDQWFPGCCNSCTLVSKVKLCMVINLGATIWRPSPIISLSFQVHCIYFLSVTYPCDHAVEIPRESLTANTHHTATPWARVSAEYSQSLHSALVCFSREKTYSREPLVK